MRRFAFPLGWSSARRAALAAALAASAAFAIGAGPAFADDIDSNLEPRNGSPSTTIPEEGPRPINPAPPAEEAKPAYPALPPLPPRAPEPNVPDDPFSRRADPDSNTTQ